MKTTRIMAVAVERVLAPRMTTNSTKVSVDESEPTKIAGYYFAVRAHAVY